MSRVYDTAGRPRHQQQLCAYRTTGTRFAGLFLGVLSSYFDVWQSDSSVVVTILIKNVPQESLNVVYTESTLSVTIKLATGADYNLELDLWHKIVPAECSAKALSSKVEVKLKKQSAIRWSKLESDGVAVDTKAAVVMVSPDQIQKKPEKNWDKLVTQADAEAGEDKPTGEAALNEFFQDLYGKGEMKG